MIWIDNCQKSLEKLRSILKSAPVLLAPSFDKELKLAIDANDVGAGSVLLQEDDNGADHSVLDGWLRMGLLPPPREFCRHILSCIELKAESFKRCLHSVLWGVSL